MLAFLGPISLIVATLPVLISGLSAGAQAVFDLAKNSAAAESKVFVLTQQLDLHAETLSTIDVAAKLTGKTVDSLAGSFATFDKNIAKAAGGDKRLSNFFRELQIDVTNNEQALRQLFSVIAAIPEGERQLQVAHEAFGSSSEDVLAVIKETNGDLFEAQKRFSALGLVLSNDAVRASHEFQRQFILVDQQIEAVKLRI
ncbi:MAG: hypothetical protein DMF69_21640, partial [Acidobacteria bacterium]